MTPKKRRPRPSKFPSMMEAEHYASERRYKTLQFISEKGEIRLQCVTPAGKPRTLKVKLP